MSEANIKLSAVDATKAAFDSVGRSLGTLKSQAGEVNDKLSGLAAGFAAIGVGLSVAGFVGLLKGAVDAADGLNKLSQRTGMATESLSQWQYVAKMSDINADTLTGTIRKLNISIAEGLAGDKQKIAQFKQLGISTSDLGKGTESVMLKMADAYAGATDGAGKVAIGNGLMGKSADEMIPLLNGGAQAILDMKKEADRLGLTIGADFAKSAEEFNDNLTRVQISSQKLAIALAGDFIDGLGRAMKAMADATIEGGKLSGVIAGLQTLLTGDGRHKANVSIVEGTDRVFAAEAALDKARARGNERDVLRLTNAVKLRREELAVHQNYAKFLDEEEGKAKVKGAAAGAQKGELKAPPTESAVVNPQIKAYQDLIATIREKIGANLQEVEAGRKLTDAEKQKLDIDKLVAKGSISAADASSTKTQALLAEFFASEQLRIMAETRIAAEKALREMEQKRIEQLEKSVVTMADANKQLKEEVQLIGLTDHAQYALTQQRLADAIATKEQALARMQNAEFMSREQIALEEEIRLMKERLSLQGSKFGAEQSAKAAEESAAAWKSFYGELNQGLTDSLFRAFESGKGFFSTLWSGIKNLFKTTALKLLIEPVSGAAKNLFGGGLGGSGSGAGGFLGMVNNASTLNTVYGAGAQALFGGAAGASGASLFGANAVGAVGGDALGALITANGGWAGVSGAASLSGAAGIALEGGTVAAAAGSSAAGAGAMSGVTSALGAIPVWGWAAMAAIAVASMFGGRGDKEVTGGGIEGQFGPAGFSGNNFSTWKQDGGWFHSDRDGKDTSPMAAATTKQLTDGYAALQKSAIGSAAALGISADGILNYSESISVTLTNDAAKNQELITKMFADMGDNIASTVAPALFVFAKDGEAASTTMTRLSTSLTTANSWLGMLRQRLFQVSLSGADAASKLVDAMGGLDRFVAASQVFYDQFFTEGEKMARTQEEMTKALAAVNLTLPTSKEAFRDLAGSLDLNTDSGRAAYATLLALAPTFASTADALSALSKETAEKLIATFTGGGQLVPALGLAAAKTLGLASNLSTTLVGSLSETQIRSLALAVGMSETQVRAGALTDQAWALGGQLYDAAGKAVSLKDQAWALGGQLYDAAGNALNTSSQFGGLTSSVFGAAVNALNTSNQFGGMNVQLYDAAGKAVVLSQAAGAISLHFLDANSGLIGFGGGVSGLAPLFTGAQLAGILLNAELDDMRLNAGQARIDFEGLSAALALVDTETFANTLSLVFESLATRLSGVLDSIGSERVALREAALQIINPTVMSKAAIERQIASVNTVLPGNASVVAAQQHLTHVDGLVTGAKGHLAAAQAQAVDRTALDAAVNTLGLAANRTAAAQAGVNHMLSYGNGNFNWFMDQAYAGNDLRGSVPNPSGEYYAQSAVFELLAAQAAQGSAQSGYNTQLGAFNQAQAAHEAVLAPIKAYLAELTNLHLPWAVQNAQNALTAYTAAMQDFSIDASKSVTKLSKLREETVKYYEAQKQLADLMTTSAANLRGTVADYKYSQLTPDQQYVSLGEQFNTAYAMALSTSGETLAGYGDKLNSLLNPLLEKGRELYGGTSEFAAFEATMLARAEAIAARLDTLTPTNYAADSLALLGQIDATLAALDASSKSAEKIIADAVAAGSEKTAAGLRAVIAAVTGQSIPAFAAGGFHSGGVRLVGENGPELEVTGPSRIFSSSQTRSMLGGGQDGRALAAELRALRQDNANMRIELQAIARSNAAMLRLAQRAETDGTLVRTDADTPLATVTA